VFTALRSGMLLCGCQGCPHESPTMKNTKPTGISEKVMRLLETYTMIAQKHHQSAPFLKEHRRDRD
jgi:hypothetical protein